MSTKEFNTSLVREKISFSGEGALFAPSEGAESGKTVVRSNRIVLELENSIGKKESLVVRSQTMASCLRFASRLMYNYFRSGLFMNRENPYEWTQSWNAVVSSYDRLYRPNLWGSVHINGVGVFKTHNSPLVDVLEKCALLSKDDYDAVGNVTEKALRQIGYEARIQHESNIAAVFFDKGDSIRCGIVYRDKSSDATFNFSAKGGEREVRIVEALRITSAFLEGIDLRFTSRNLQERIRRRELPQLGPHAIQQRKAYLRLLAVNRVITHFEEVFEVRYRPEKPEFFRKS